MGTHILGRKRCRIQAAGTLSLSPPGAILVGRDRMRHEKDRAGSRREHELLLDLIRRFSRLTPEQKIRATMINNRATLRLRELWNRKTS